MEYDSNEKILRGMKRGSFSQKLTYVFYIIWRKLDRVDKKCTICFSHNTIKNTNICLKINLMVIHIENHAENIVKRCIWEKNKLFLYYTLYVYSLINKQELSSIYNHNIHGKRLMKIKPLNVAQKQDNFWNCLMRITKLQYEFCKTKLMANFL